jgi:hypothetical protein
LKIEAQRDHLRHVAYFLHHFQNHRAGPLFSGA